MRGQLLEVIKAIENFRKDLSTTYHVLASSPKGVQLGSEFAEMQE